MQFTCYCLFLISYGIISYDLIVVGYTPTTTKLITHTAYSTSMHGKPKLVQPLLAVGEDKDMVKIAVDDDDGDDDGDDVHEDAGTDLILRSGFGASAFLSAFGWFMNVSAGLSIATLLLSDPRLSKALNDKVWKVYRLFASMGLWDGTRFLYASVFSWVLAGMVERNEFSSLRMKLLLKAQFNYSAVCLISGSINGSRLLKGGLLNCLMYSIPLITSVGALVRVTTKAISDNGLEEIWDNAKSFKELKNETIRRTVSITEVQNIWEKRPLLDWATLALTILKTLELIQATVLFTLFRNFPAGMKTLRTWTTLDMFSVGINALKLTKDQDDDDYCKGRVKGKSRVKMIKYAMWFSIIAFVWGLFERTTGSGPMVMKEINQIIIKTTTPQPSTAPSLV